MPLFHDLRDSAHYSQLFQCTKYFRTVQLYCQIVPHLSNNLLDTNPKFSDFGPLLVYSSHYLGAVDNYNKEKVIATNKITPATGVTKTNEVPPLKLFVYFRGNIY